LWEFRRRRFIALNRYAVLEPDQDRVIIHAIWPGGEQQITVSHDLWIATDTLKKLYFATKIDM